MPRTLPLILIALLIAGCGGGGGGDNDSPPVTTDPPTDPPTTPEDPPTTPTNGAPVVSVTVFSTGEDADLVATLTATDPDNDAVTFAKTGNPAHGQVVSFQTNGAFTYRPAANFNGTDSFTIQASDTASHHVAATISVTVSAVNDAPTIKDDVATVTAANPVVDVLDNDVDPDGDALTLTIETGPLYGTASVVDGKVELTLPTGFRGFNRFTYRAVDSMGLGGTATAAVFVDTQPARLVYQTDEEQIGVQNLYVNDLIQPRRISAFTGSGTTFLGRSNVSDNGRSIVFEEATGTLGANYRPQIIWTAPADGSSAARKISAPLQAGEQLGVRSSLSGDGKWVVYGLTATSGVETLYLASLEPGGTAVPIPLPAGAARIETSQLIQFGPSSQFVYFTASFPFAGSTVGQATYRIPVTNPAAAERLSSPAVADRQAAVVLVSSDDARAVQVAINGATPTIERIDTAHPGSTVVLSTGIGAGENLIGIDSNPTLTRVAYVVDRLTTPAEYDLYVADAATASSGTLVAHLPADEPAPRLHGITPNGDAALFSAVRVVGGFFHDELYEVGLTAGATAKLIQSRIVGEVSYSYIDAGQSIAFTADPGVAVVSRGALSSAESVFGKDTALYEFSPDGGLLGAVTNTTDPSPVHLWLVNRGGSTPPLQITGLVKPASQTLSLRVVPAN